VCARLNVAVGHAHATASRDVETEELSVYDDGNVTEAVGEHVDVVLGWDSNRNLELAREIRWAVPVQRVGGRREGV
jgi:hypothetical protein